MNAVCRMHGVIFRRLRIPVSMLSGQGSFCPACLWGSAEGTDLVRPGCWRVFAGLVGRSDSLLFRNAQRTCGSSCVCGLVGRFGWLPLAEAARQGLVLSQLALPYCKAMLLVSCSGTQSTVRHQNSTSRSALPVLFACHLRVCYLCGPGFGRAWHLAHASILPPLNRPPPQSSTTCPPEWQQKPTSHGARPNWKRSRPSTISKRNE